MTAVYNQDAGRLYSKDLQDSVVVFCLSILLKVFSIIGKLELVAPHYSQSLLETAAEVIECSLPFQIRHST